MRSIRLWNNLPWEMVEIPLLKIRLSASKGTNPGLASPQSFRADELIALTYAFPSTQTSDIPQYYLGRSNKGSCSTSYAILPHGCAPSACEYITPRGKKKRVILSPRQELPQRMAVLASWGLGLGPGAPSSASSAAGGLTPGPLPGSPPALP